MRDKFSDDKTIEITGGTQTLTIKDNLEVIDTITTVDLSITGQITGSLDVEGDLLVGDDLTVTGDVTIGESLVVGLDVVADDYDFTSEKTLLINCPLAIVYSDMLYSDYTGNLPVLAESVGIAGYSALQIGDGHPDLTWEYYFAVDRIVPMNCRITGMYIYAAHAAFNTNNMTVVATLEVSDLEGTGATWTQLATDSVTFTYIAPPPVTRTKATYNFSTATLQSFDEKIARIKIAKTSGEPAGALEIYKIIVTVATTSIASRLGEI